MPETARAPGILLGIARFYHDPRGSIRGVIAGRPSDAKQLLFAMFACAILLLGRIMREIMEGNAGVQLAEKISAEAVSLLFFVPLFYYLLAAIGTILARVFRGQGNWHDGRTAFFWAALVSAPVIILSSLAATGAASFGDVAGVVVGQIGAVFFAWALAQCYAEAFGFTRVWAVMAVICLPALALMGALYVFTH